MFEGIFDIWLEAVVVLVCSRGQPLAALLCLLMTAVHAFDQPRQCHTLNFSHDPTVCLDHRLDVEVLKTLTELS